MSTPIAKMSVDDFICHVNQKQFDTAVYEGPLDNEPPPRGTTYMTCLKEMRPGLHQKVEGTALDPSGSDDPSAFLVWLGQYWK